MFPDIEGLFECLGQFGSINRQIEVKGDILKLQLVAVRVTPPHNLLKVEAFKSKDVRHEELAPRAGYLVLEVLLYDV